MAGPKLQTKPPCRTLGCFAKAPDDLRLLPTLTRVQRLGSSSLGEKKTEVPPPAGRVVTSPYRQPVVGVAARHVIHAPLNPARALPPPPPTRLPPLPPPLPNFRPPCSLTAVNRASSALPLPWRPHQRRRRGLRSSGPRSPSAGWVPPYPTLSPNPSAQGAWASGVQWRQRQFSTHSSHRGPGGLCRSAFKGDGERRTASREPPPLTLRPALPASRAELRFSRGGRA